MENSMDINDIMKLLHPLSATNKLEIISRLTRDLKTDFPNENEPKSILLDELYGSWHDVGNEIINDILKSRTTSSKDINLE